MAHMARAFPAKPAEWESNEVLGELVSLAQDNADGFRFAAEALRAWPFKQLFMDFARQADDFSALLNHTLNHLQVQQQRAPAGLHRAWLRLRPAIGKGDERAILDACEQSIAALCNCCKATAKLAIPDAVRTLLLKQQAALNASQDRLRSLRRSLGIR
jgi:uncharacterized protein (TIGR02284 family)